MSTRCTIHFHYGEHPAEAIVYRHSDGYPDGVLPDLERFFTAVKEQCNHSRFDDPAFLAAKFIVWEALDNNAERATKPLDFWGVAPMMVDPGDIEYRYHVRCMGGRLDESEHPTPVVTYEVAM